LNAEWAQWLKGFQWTLFVTLTTEREWQPNGWEAATRRYLHSIERQFGACWWFYAIELGGGGRWHAHVLIGGLDARLAGEVAACWKVGGVQVRPYDQRRRGAAYIVKQVISEEHPYDFSERLPAKFNAWRQARWREARRRGNAKSC
jgi:hypothetical protein